MSGHLSKPLLSDKVVIGAGVNAAGVGKRRGLLWRGERRLLSDWCRRLDLVRRTVEYRLSRGWTINEAFTCRAGDVPDRLRPERRHHEPRPSDGLRAVAR